MLDYPDETFSIDVEDVEKATDKAILCLLETGKKMWVPKSVIHDDSEVWKEDDEGTLVVKRWWAEKNNLV